MNLPQKQVLDLPEEKPPSPLVKTSTSFASMPKNWLSKSSISDWIRWPRKRAMLRWVASPQSDGCSHWKSRWILRDSDFEAPNLDQNWRTSSIRHHPTSRPSPATTGETTCWSVAPWQVIEKPMVCSALSQMLTGQGSIWKKGGFSLEIVEIIILSGNSSSNPADSGRVEVFLFTRG